MSIKVFSNIPALRAQEALRKTNRELGQTFERLSSGMRINRASDDAAGLSVADRLRADSRMANVAVRNINDGISLVSIYEGALNEITNVLTRMSELAKRFENGINSATQRSSLNAEFTALGSEINRIRSSTEFNNINPFMSGTVWIQAMSRDRDTQIPLFLDEVGSLNTVSESQLELYVDVTTTINQAMNDIGLVRADNSSRLEFAKNHMEILRENYSAADSTIRDADIAIEAAKLTYETIRQQAATAVLAQANQQPQIALQLLEAGFTKKEGKEK